MTGSFFQDPHRRPLGIWTVFKSRDVPGHTWHVAAKHKMPRNYDLSRLQRMDDTCYCWAYMWAVGETVAKSQALL